MYLSHTHTLTKEYSCEIYLYEKICDFLMFTVVTYNKVGFLMHVYIYIYIYIYNIYIYLHRHVFHPSQESSVWLGLTSIYFDRSFFYVSFHSCDTIFVFKNTFSFLRIFVLLIGSIMQMLSLYYFR